MGAFSKTFCSCGGFLATSAAAVKDYVRIFGGTFMFSNALSAPQAAVALEAVRITRSPEGDALRAELQRAARTLRGAFAERGIHCYGDPCAIVAVPVGDETVIRLAATVLADQGVLANLVEFPAVGIGRARFRMQLMPGHTDEMLERAAGLVADAIDEAKAMAEREGVAA
jgi:glycine C-acetyltransferase